MLKKIKVKKKEREKWAVFWYHSRYTWKQAICLYANTFNPYVEQTWFIETTEEKQYSS